MVAQPLAQLASGAPYQPTLWKLASADSVVYLLGSFHLGLPEMFPLPQSIEGALAASSVLLVDTNFTSFGPQERSPHRGNPTGKSILAAQLLSEDTCHQ